MSCLAVAWFARRHSIACMIALSALGFIVPGLFAQTAPPMPIGTAIADADRDFIPDHAATTVTIGGRATVASGVLHDDRLDVFIQDHTGGIRLVAPNTFPPIALGDSIVATGTLEHINGLTQLSTIAYRVVPGTPAPPDPLPIDLASTVLEPYEGRLGQIKGYVASKGRARTGHYLNIAVGDSAVVAFIFTSNRASEAFDDIQLSDYVCITGIIGQYDQVKPYNASYQIYPRYASDIRMAGLPPRLYRNMVLGVSALLLAVLAWVYALRRQVRRRIADLKASDARYQMLFQNAGDALFVHGLQKGAASPLVEVNTVACDVLGYPPEALTTRSLADLVDASSRERLDRLIEILGYQEQAISDLTLLTSDARAIPFEITSHVFLMDGRPTVLSVARDVTQRKAYEQGLIDAKQQAETLAELKTAFLANMSHEIRTPLTSIIGFADLLTEDESLVTEVAEHIRASGHRLMETINYILDVSRGCGRPPL